MAPIKFGSGSLFPKPTREIDPREIFKARPAIDSQVNDLWQGQAAALEEWHNHRTENDILISLNTGAGKSLVGALICQSLLNEGLDNPVYLCATNDLVEQTASECQKLGLKYSTRIGSEYNTPYFVEGNGFLITSYQTLFNSRSVLRGDLAPQAILFDDAHVGEQTIRSQYTVQISSSKHSSIYSEVVQAIRSTLTDDNVGRLGYAISELGLPGGFLCPPATGAAIAGLLDGLFPRVSALNDSTLFFPYEYLLLHWHACAIVCTKSAIEISPTFLPVRALREFSDKNVRRIYLSATLNSSSDFIRAYGRAPKRKIQPAVDAGNGERTIISATRLKDSDKTTTWTAGMARREKVLVAVTSRREAKAWVETAPLYEGKSFQEKLAEFRSKRGAAGFVMAGRFDGIDLPHATCRLMVVAGLPTGASALEGYLFRVLDMRNLLAGKMATRITQLMGRIIRARNDFGFFLLVGGDLTNWIKRDRNLALLPDLLQKQFKLGEHIQSEYGIDTLDAAKELYEQVLLREESWLQFYREFIDSYPLDPKQVAVRAAIEHVQIQSAKAEAKYGAALWNRRFADAAAELEPQIDAISAGDAKLGGWLNYWTGGAYEMDGNLSSAVEHYRLAASRLRLATALPMDDPDGDVAPDLAALGPVARSMAELAFASQRQASNAARRAVRALEEELAPDGTPYQAEEAVRQIGSHLGLTATRPDNDLDNGPDGLWVDEINRILISIELKTDKTKKLNKSDTGQSHDNVQWVANEYTDYGHIGHLFICDTAEVTRAANPGPSWYAGDMEKLKALVVSFNAELMKIRRLPKEERLRAIQTLDGRNEWRLDGILTRLSNSEITK
jgi:hypothetical protein